MRGMRLWYVVLGAGCAFGSAFIIPSVSFVVFFAYIPLMVLALRQGRARQIFWYGSLFAGSANAFAFSWLFSALPLTWLIPNPGLAFLTILGCLLVVASIGGGVIGVWAVLLHYVWKKSYHLSHALRASLWVAFAGVSLAACEYIRLRVYSFVFMGHDSLPMYLSFGSPAYLIANFSGLVQFARFGDLYALTALVGCFCAVASLIYVHDTKQFLLKIALYGALLLVINFLATPPEQAVQIPQLHLIGITINAPVLSDRELPAREALKGVAYQDALVVFPEGTGSSARTALSGAQSAVIYSNLRTASDGTTRSSAYFVSSTTEQVIDKNMLALGGEYMPTFLRSLFEIIRLDGGRRHERPKNLTPGATTHLFTTTTGMIGILFCNELFSPTYAHLLSQQGAQLLVVLTSHAWFSYSPALEAQTLAALRVRAVSAGVPVVQISNVGDSYLISKFGRVLTHAEPGHTLDVHISP